ncbi:MAG: carboxynorspermidine decarboxylase [Oscillospiraceae bacterium]|nr:carboxynorspermidine decarboxylase [Oscillospiraceae bacterium]
MKFESMPTPFYFVDQALLIKNLEILRTVTDRTGCRILLAQKAFSMFSLYPLIGRYLHGTAASGLFEARLGFEEMGLENHVFSAAYKENEFDEILKLCSHIIFNSFSQWEIFRNKANGHECGIRLNPGHSTASRAMYDPCTPGSRLGVTLENFRPGLMDGISGFHFHTLCEQNSHALVSTLEVFEQKFGKWLHDVKWLNIGGGHHITRDDYDIDKLVDCINRLQKQYNLLVYAEPGEAVALNSGFLVASVLDIIANDFNSAILDASAACHMPDVLEVPYRPEIVGAGMPGEKPFNYRLCGHTCLAGDIIGEYSFDRPLKRNDRLIFCDMAHYSMVKNNTFNGMPLPSIAVKNTEGDYIAVKRFAYDDFRNRLS